MLLLRTIPKASSILQMLLLLLLIMLMLIMLPSDAGALAVNGYDPMREKEQMREGGLAAMFGLDCPLLSSIVLLGLIRSHTINPPHLQ